MHKEFLMGNEAIALGALAAGVNLAAGYPGTPSTEVLETIARRNPGSVHVEWSVNEKAAMEVAGGAAYAGARTLVTMKQMGMNVASDPMMCLSYIGVKGGMVVMVADDPGPISSQTEQDTRTFAQYAKVPVFDASSVAEAYEMIQEAFDFSETYGTPVIFRATTRVDHGYEAISVKDPEEYRTHVPDGFVKDSSRWVIFPKLSVKNHALIEKRNADLTAVLSEYPRNGIEAETAYPGRGIAAHGISYRYTEDVLGEERPRILKVATPFPFPEELALRFLDGLKEVLCIEELDPVIERALLHTAGKYRLPVKIRGKLTGDIRPSGENSPASVLEAIDRYLGTENAAGAALPKDPVPPLPVRPPVLCGGCPHRASFYAVKQAMKGKKTIYCGDIGCYTLGNAMPLDMCDTCLCMGAGINIAQGVFHVEPDTKAFAFVGDSTFFASGITGAVNAVYNQTDMTLVILDNSTTAMTGHQPHPGTGRTLMGRAVEPVSIPAVLKAVGASSVETVDPLDHKQAVEAVKRAAELPGLKAIIFKSPCIALTKPKGRSHVDPDACIACGKCIRELGCPGLIKKDGKAYIDSAQCTGCTLCEQICPVHAISGGGKNEAGKQAPAAESQKQAPASGSEGDKRGFGETAGSAEANMPFGKLSLEDSNCEQAEKRIADARFAKNIILCGVGGQGTILASRLIADAAMKQDIPVKTAETIGMAQRGGSVFSHLRMGECAGPMIEPGGADLIIGFEPAETVRMLSYLKENGSVVVSARPVMPVSAMIGAAPYPYEEVLAYLKAHVRNLTLIDTEQAVRDLGSDKVLNVVLLGAAAESGELGLTVDDLREAMHARLPERLHEVNDRALEYTLQTRQA